MRGPAVKRRGSPLQGFVWPAFREWLHSADFPETGRFDWLQGRVEVNVEVTAGPIRMWNIIPPASPLGRGERDPAPFELERFRRAVQHGVSGMRPCHSTLRTDLR